MAFSAAHSQQNICNKIWAMSVHIIHTMHKPVIEGKKKVTKIKVIVHK